MTPGPGLSGGVGMVGVWLTGVMIVGLERKKKSHTVSLYIVLNNNRNTMVTDCRHTIYQYKYITYTYIGTTYMYVHIGSVISALNLRLKLWACRLSTKSVRVCPPPTPRY